MKTSKLHGIKLTPPIRAIMLAVFSLGATAAFADDPKYGGIYFNDAVEVDGVAYPAGSTIYAETYPVQMVVKPIVPEGKTFQWYASKVPRATYITSRRSENSFYGSLNEKFPTVRLAKMDGTYLMTPPGDKNVVITNKAVYASKVVYVATNGTDVATAGSEAEPFETIQYAVEYLYDNYKSLNTMILVKPGVYDKGGDEGDASNLRSRVFVHANQHVLIKSTDGAEKTIIEGEIDPEGTGGHGDGARRCVTFQVNADGDACIQGFTFRKGRTAIRSGQSCLNQGGGIGAQRSNYVISQHIAADCVFTNCTAQYTSGAAWNMWLFRCHVIGGGSTATAGDYLSGTLVDGAEGGRIGNLAWQSSGRGGFGLVTFNSIGGSQRLGPDGTYYGTVYTWNGQDGTNLGYKNSTGYVVNLSAGDLRPVETGAANFGSNVPEEGTDMWYFWTDVMAELACGDVNGDKILWKDGVPVSGAQMKVVKFRDVYVDVPTGAGVDLTGTTANETNKVETGAVITMKPNSSGLCDVVAVVHDSTTNYFANLPDETYSYTVPEDLEDTAVFTFVRGKSCPVLVTVPASVGVDVTGLTPGEVAYMSPGRTITLTPNETKNRYALGVVVGGVTNLFLQQPNRTVVYTMPADIDESQQLDFTVLVSNDWYVSPTGDNANNGFTPTSPWRTLCYAMSKCQSGQRVLALPGIYAEGVADRDMTYTTPRSDIPRCRVAVRMGSVLESTDGPEKTIIMGAPSTDPSADEFGRGPGAVGCVRMTSAKAGYSEVVRGFTLTGGRTALTGSDEMKGGAACYALWAGHEDYARLENCIISNNYSYSTTLAGLSAVGCVITTNFVVSGSSSGSTSRYYGTLVKDGRASDLHELKNSTIGKEATFNMRSDASYRNCANCLIMGTVAWHSNDMTFTNCVFLTGKAAYKRIDCIITNEAAIAVDENYVPTNRSSAVVDYAGEKYGTPSYVFASKDARGGQRVYNGALDVGAVEYDWRGDFAKDIAKREVVVTAADPQVIEREGKVTLDPGATLTAEWTPVGESARCDVKASVTGTGTLTVSVDGAAIGTVTAADSPKTFNFAGAIGETSKIVFSYSQEEDDEGCAVIEKIGSQKGLLLLVR